MDRNALKLGILYLLDTPSRQDNGEEYTFLEIREFLKLNNVTDYHEVDETSWRRLKDLLREMAEEGLIEERHSGTENDEIITYSIEDKGVEMLTTESLAELTKKWKLQ